ncbi:diaminobutyrate acetyltransferase [Sphingomonas laterariae]|uniref:L-2,4-diaminobutyric acid acetyltransferase n=1 Tax=Edaphosphingomonas laterariae TaxID=861865 RepID=A0A239DHA1_9SPHN|nr:diaminobutyrate acetyltransferase [Sphingomonas laterariae]
MQCSDFAESCILAERDGELLGWVSGYRPPSDPANFFVWQVAVAPAARGRKLAQRMIEALVQRPAAAGVTHLTTTITDDNRASWALFNGLARRWRAPMEKSTRFDRDAHFGGAHATEWQARIGPLPF